MAAAKHSSSAQAWLGIVISPLLLVACTSSSPAGSPSATPTEHHSGIGVGTEEGSGRVGIAYLPCTGEKVTAVELSTDPKSGARQTIWRISAGPTAVEATQFIIGESPAGWQAAVTMKDLPSKSETLAVFVETTTRSPGGISFLIADLVPGAIMSDDGPVPPAEFVKSQDYC